MQVSALSDLHLKENGEIKDLYSEVQDMLLH